MLWVVKEIVERALLDYAPRVHDNHAVRDVGDDSQVVGYEDDAGVGLRPQIAQLVKDLRLDRDVERGGGLVGDQQLR